MKNNLSCSISIALIIFILTLSSNVLNVSGWTIFFIIIIFIAFIQITKEKSQKRKQDLKEAEEQARKIAEEKARKLVEEEARKIAEEEKKKQAEKKEAQEKERKRINGVYSKIEEIKATYSPKAILFSVSESVDKIRYDASYINTEVNTAVRTFKESMKSLVKECNTIDAQIHSILSHQCVSSYQPDPDKVLSYLNEHIDELKDLKNKSLSLHAQIEKKKIVLLNHGKYALDSIKHSFTELIKSKKCIGDNTSASGLICKTKPSELAMFSYKDEPLILDFMSYKYCFFGDVILVFDRQGFYMTALDSSILRLTIKRCSEDVIYHEHTMLYSKIKYMTPKYGKYTDSDSYTVSNGEIKEKWKYARKDGGADLRYKDNTVSRSRVDKVMYGEVSFYLSEKITFQFSSYNAITAFEKAKKAYQKKYIKKDTLPDFLNLMQMLAPKNAMMDDISKKYKAKSTSYFCKIT